MAEESFKEYGKEEAIALLYESAGIDMVSNPSYEPASGSEIVSSSRLFVEGIDFDLTYFPLKHLGYKCAAAAAGEIYAAMGHPRSLAIRLGVSAKLDFGHIKDLWSGVTVAMREHGFKTVDLDLVPSPNGLTIAVSANGERLKLTKGRTVKARSKDLVCVSGSLGAAYLGQQILEREKRGFENTADDSSQPDLEKYKMLIGSSPENIRHFVELRGIGIINARRIFGMGSVKVSEKIDMVITLENWDKAKVYDRMGIDNEYTEILDVEVPCLTIPVKPGRNLSIIIEVAAMNNRQKKMGYNAAQELLANLGMNIGVEDNKRKLDW